MRYSVLSRFEGGLLGGAIAGKRIGSREFSAGGLAAEKLQESALLNFLDGGRFEAENGRAAGEQWLGQLKVGEVAIALFPIALYSHHHRANLHARTREAAALWLQKGENPAELLLWADAIALILREQLPTDGLLPALLADSPTSALLPLYKADRPLNALARSSQEFSPLVLALYCFAATPEDFNLCVDRAIASADVPPITARLVGAIAGLYNSSHNLPARPQLPASEIETWQRRARQLFAAWSGVHRPDTTLSSPSVVARAGSLQPRASLEIISRDPRF